MSSELERLDDLSPDESVGAFGGSGQWIEIGTVKDIREKFALVEALKAENARLREAVDNTSGFLDTPIARRQNSKDPMYAEVVASIRRAREGGNADG